MAGDAIGMCKALVTNRAPKITLGNPYEFRQCVLFSNSVGTHDRSTICSTTGALSPVFGSGFRIRAV